MEPEFDYNSFATRYKLKQREAAEVVGVSTGLIAAWASRRAVPSYESMCKLIEAGMSAKELFGAELAKKLIENSDVQTMIKPSKEEFDEGVRAALAELLLKKQ